MEAYISGASTRFAMWMRDYHADERIHVWLLLEWLLVSISWNGPCVKARAGVQTPCKTCEEAIPLLHGAALQTVHIRVGLPLSYRPEKLLHA